MFAFGFIAYLRHGITYLLVSMLVYTVAAVVCHELGHLLAARAIKFKILEFAVGPLALVRDKVGYRLRWRWLPWPLLGRVIAAPTTDRRLRQKHLILAIAGPIANVILGALCLILNWIPAIPELPAAVWHAAVPIEIASWLNVVGCGSLTLAAFNMFPAIVAGHQNDGKTVLDCLLRGSSVERLIKLQQVAQASHSGIRARDWDVEAINFALSACDGSAVDIVAHLQAYYHAVDSGDADRAGAMLDFALANRTLYPIERRPAILVEGAYFEGFFRLDAVKAHRWLDQQTATGTVEQQTRLRAEAAVLFADRRYSEAISKATAGIAAAPQSEDRGGSISEIDWLNAIIAGCQKALARDANLI